MSYLGRGDAGRRLFVLSFTHLFSCFLCSASAVKVVLGSVPDGAFYLFIAYGISCPAFLKENWKRTQGSARSRGQETMRLRVGSGTEELHGKLRDSFRLLGTFLHIIFTVRDTGTGKALPIPLKIFSLCNQWGFRKCSLM